MPKRGRPNHGGSRDGGGGGGGGEAGGAAGGGWGGGGSGGSGDGGGAPAAAAEVVAAREAELMDLCEHLSWWKVCLVPYQRTAPRRPPWTIRRLEASRSAA